MEIHRNSHTAGLSAALARNSRLSDSKDLPFRLPTLKLTFLSNTSSPRPSTTAVLPTPANGSTVPAKPAAASSSSSLSSTHTATPSTSSNLHFDTTSNSDSIGKATFLAHSPSILSTSEPVDRVVSEDLGSNDACRRSVRIRARRSTQGNRVSMAELSDTESEDDSADEDTISSHHRSSNLVGRRSNDSSPNYSKKPTSNSKKDRAVKPYRVTSSISSQSSTGSSPSNDKYLHNSNPGTQSKLQKVSHSSGGSGKPRKRRIKYGSKYNEDEFPADGQRGSQPDSTQQRQKSYCRSLSPSHSGSSLMTRVDQQRVASSTRSSSQTQLAAGDLQCQPHSGTAMSISRRSATTDRSDSASSTHLQSSLSEMVPIDPATVSPRFLGLWKTHADHNRSSGRWALPLSTVDGRRGHNESVSDNKIDVMDIDRGEVSVRDREDLTGYGSRVYSAAGARRAVGDGSRKTFFTPTSTQSDANYDGFRYPLGSAGIPFGELNDSIRQHKHANLLNSPFGCIKSKPVLLQEDVDMSDQVDPLSSTTLNGVSTGVNRSLNGSTSLGTSGREASSSNTGLLIDFSPSDSMVGVTPTTATETACDRNQESRTGSGARPMSHRGPFQSFRKPDGFRFEYLVRTLPLQSAPPKKSGTSGVVRPLPSWNNTTPGNVIVGDADLIPFSMHDPSVSSDIQLNCAIVRAIKRAGSWAVPSALEDSFTSDRETDDGGDDSSYDYDLNVLAQDGASAERRMETGHGSGKSRHNGALSFGSTRLFKRRAKGGVPRVQQILSPPDSSRLFSALIDQPIPWSIFTSTMDDAPARLSVMRSPGEREYIPSTFPPLFSNSQHKSENMMSLSGILTPTDEMLSNPSPDEDMLPSNLIPAASYASHKRKQAPIDDILNRTHHRRSSLQQHRFSHPFSHWVLPDYNPKAISYVQDDFLVRPFLSHNAKPLTHHPFPTQESLASRRNAGLGKSMQERYPRTTSSLYSRQSTKQRPNTIAYRSLSRFRLGAEYFHVGDLVRLGPSIHKHTRGKHSHTTPYLPPPQTTPVLSATASTASTSGLPSHGQARFLHVHRIISVTGGNSGSADEYKDMNVSSQSRSRSQSRSPTKAERAQSLTDLESMRSHMGRIQRTLRLELLGARQEGDPGDQEIHGPYWRSAADGLGVSLDDSGAASTRDTVWICGLLYILEPSVNNHNHNHNSHTVTSSSSAAVSSSNQAKYRLNNNNNNSSKSHHGSTIASGEFQAATESITCWDEADDVVRGNTDSDAFLLMRMSGSDLGVHEWRDSGAIITSSGVGIHSDVISRFEEMKLGHQHAYLVFKISEDGSQIVVDQVLSTADAKRLGSEATYSKFVGALPAKEARYGVFELEYNTGLGGLRSKLIIVSWNPDEGPIRSRMIYASSKAALCQRLDGIHSEVQCTDASDIAFQSIFDTVAPKGAVPSVKPPTPNEE
ncbi:hypothetical protein BSLG_007449 [Batrachochytrium salamandrivorans]|nr:hypothetical protein BSLG_007449 [Batrachochytrium salamandrivorans]